MKLTKTTIVIVVLVFFVIIYWLLHRKKNAIIGTTTSPIVASDTASFVGSRSSGNSNNSTTTSAFSIFSGYGTNTPYASIADCYLQNADDSTATQLQKTLWSEKLETGSIAYTDANKTAKLAQGFYYYAPTNFAFSVDANGVMTFTPDVPFGTGVEVGN